MDRTPKHPKVSEETKSKIIDYWRFNKDNQASTIASLFDCHVSQIHTVIDKYLSSKIRS